MRKKANLRNVDGPNVYITYDLTKMPGKILYELKQDVEIERAYSLDCKITCVKKMPDSPDDLFTIGWSEEKVKDLGLYIN